MRTSGMRSVARIRRYSVWCLLAALGLVPGSLEAQETREAIVAAAQAEKAANLVPYKPGGAEQLLIKVKREFLELPSGFYPVFASVYSGGGFTLGAGYRQFYGDRTFWDVKGLYSISGYKRVEVSTDSLGHAGGRLDLHLRTGWMDATQVDYFGLGINSPQSTESNFRLKEAYVGAGLNGRAAGPIVYGAGVAYEDYTTQSGTGTIPSIEDVHTPATAPGLGSNPVYLHTSAFGGLDSRPSPGYARHGSLFQVSYHNYADRNSTYSFDRADVEVVQHIPLLRENWVISLHGLLQTTLDDGDTVPYFLLPSLGSGSTLRGYGSWRFRDRHSLLMSGEWRWIPSRMGLDMAIFYDTGKVASEWDGLSLKGLAHNVGVGIRFHGPLSTPLRVELAKGREGFHLVFAGSAAF